VTHASSTHESDGAEDKEEENPPPKGKRVASEDAEDGMWPEGLKRSKQTPAGAAIKATMSERAIISGESGDDPLTMRKKKPAPRRSIIVFCV
jgi:hypothetical protein